MGKIPFKNFGQLDFWSEQIFKEMPPDKFLDAVSENIDFSFADTICEPFYSHLGQNAYAPSLMLKIRFLHAYFNLSDRQLEYGLRYNLAYKKFVGIPANYYSFDHSSREDFDSRIPVGIHKAIFFHIFAQIQDLGLLNPKEQWIIDATHSLSRATHHTAAGLIRQGITQLLYALRRAAGGWTNAADRELKLTDITEERLHYKAAEEKKLQYFSRLVVTAYGLLVRVENLLTLGILTPKYTAEIQEKAAVLKRLLDENATPKEQDPPSHAPAYRQKPKEDKPKNPLASAIDPDARHSAKSDKKHYMGHKTQNLVTAESQFIVNMEGISATENDGAALLEIVDEAKVNTGLTPPKILADGQYTTVANFQGTRARNLELVGNIKEQVNPKGGYTLDSFHYDPVKQTLTCPAKVVTAKTYRSESTNATIFCFPQDNCNACSLKEKCTKSENGRKVSISDGYHLVIEAKEYLRTEQGKAELKLRPLIERVNGVLKNRFGLNVTKSWGASKYRIQGYWAGIAYNVSRAVKLLHEKERQSVCIASQ